MLPRSKHCFLQLDNLYTVSLVLSHSGYQYWVYFANISIVFSSYQQNQCSIYSVWMFFYFPSRYNRINAMWLPFQVQVPQRPSLAQW